MVRNLETMEFYGADTDLLMMAWEILSSQKEEETLWWSENSDDELEFQLQAVGDELMARGVM